MPANVELLCHECDVLRAMAATSRVLDRMDLLAGRGEPPADGFHVFATCPADWDASKVAVGLPQHMMRERRDYVGALLSHYMPGWGVTTWVLHRQQPPESGSIPYRYAGSSASWPAEMRFVVDWLPHG